MCCPENGVYCNNCKFYIYNQYSENTCSLHYDIECDSYSRWKCYYRCSRVNVNNECKDYKPSFFRKVKLFVRRILKKESIDGQTEI